LRSRRRLSWPSLFLHPLARTRDPVGATDAHWSFSISLAPILFGFALSPLERQGDHALIACGGLKTVSVTVQTPSADCPCGAAGRSYRRILVTEGIRRQRFELAI